VICIRPVGCEASSIAELTPALIGAPRTGYRRGHLLWRDLPGNLPMLHAKRFRSLQAFLTSTKI